MRMPSCLPELPLLCEWTARCYIRVTIRHATLQTIKTIATGGLAIVDDDGMSVKMFVSYTKSTAILETVAGANPKP